MIRHKFVEEVKEVLEEVENESSLAGLKRHTSANRSISSCSSLTESKTTIKEHTAS
jgi:hypothetical protein